MRFLSLWMSASAVLGVVALGMYYGFRFVMVIYQNLVPWARDCALMGFFVLIIAAIWAAAHSEGSDAQR